MSPDNSEPESLVGAVVAGKYRVDALLGRGGMGAVYQATHQAIGKRVALKFLWRDSTRDPETVTRFQREAEAASQVESAHIVQIFDSGISDNGLPFLVMELLVGEDLRTRLRRVGHLPLPEAVHIAGQVARGLIRAHEAGIVHRDLKPDNVYLCRRDDDPMFVKIVDFGISKVARPSNTANTLTRRGVVLGTAFYMSPEQAQAYRDVDGRTDLFSLGAILYEMLTGHPPHTGPAYEAVLIDICTKDAPDVRIRAPDVPPGVAEVVIRALCRNRDQRFQRAEEFYDALARAAPGMLRTGSSSGGPAPVLSLADGTPAPPGAAGDLTSRTSSGTTVQAESSVAPGVQTRRTVVAALVAALGAFTLTALIMARSSAPASPGASSAAPTWSARTAPRPSAESPPAEPAASASSSGSAAVVNARAEPPPSTKDPRPNRPGGHGLHREPTKKTTSPAPTGAAGVAKGLKLVTEP
jgi:serine/threonine protein kinase